MILRPQDSFPKEAWMEYADELEKQIAALKNVCIQERAFAIENNPNETIEWTHEDAMERAKEQLAYGRPDIDWDDMK